MRNGRWQANAVIALAGRDVLGEEHRRENSIGKESAVDLRDWAALIGAVTGVTGVILGILGTIDRYRRDQVRLRVTPKIAWVNRRGTALVADRSADPEVDPARGLAPNRLIVEVVNLGSFPVTISEVGFGRAGGRTRICIPLPELPSGGSLPTRLEPRQALQAFCNFPSGVEQRKGLEAARAFAETDCGAVAYGTSPAFERFVAELCDRKPLA